MLFNVILTDNGTEFSNPSAIEINPENDETRCHVFFCHPYSSFEKGNCEKIMNILDTFYQKVLILIL